MQQQTKYKIIISGGGTGGHIFPAIAIANAIKEKYSEAEILFVGAIGRMEMEKVPAAGYKIEGLWISGLQRNLFSKQNFLLPFKIMSSFFKARNIIKTFKPDVVVGTGGYASWAIVKAAASFDIPTLIQEQNSFPGKTNKDLAHNASCICVAYPGMEKYFPKDKIRLTGNPVRQDISGLTEKRKSALEYFGLVENRKTVLVIGGSLGAFTINESIISFLEEFKKRGMQLVWQTGKGYAGKAKTAIEKINESGIKSFDFIQRMDYAYAIADIVVSRAGASSVSELCIASKASILIPLPSAAEDHQTKNAMVLVNKNAAVLVKDSEARQQMKLTLFELLNDNARIKAISENAGNLAFKNAASLIAAEVISLVK